MSLGGSLGAAGIEKYSDRNLKEDIQVPVENEMHSRLQEMLDELKSYKYNYKDEKGLPQDQQYGVMAQDLEKSELGSEFVEEDQDGDKMVDYGKMAGTQLAALTELFDRVKKLEGN